MYFLAPVVAQASSFVAIAPPKETLSSSFVTLGEPASEPAGETAPGPAPVAVGTSTIDPAPTPVEEAATEPARKARSALDAPPDYDWQPQPIRVSASIVAFGRPAVEAFQVASIGTPAKKAAPRPAAKPRLDLQTLVIRGGIHGSAFPPAAAPQAAAVQAPAAKAPEAPKAPQQPSPPKPPLGLRGPELGDPE